jgi:hypothetical protein
VSAELRALIRRISLEIPLWGAPRIHGELLKLGYDVCESTIAKYMMRLAGPPSQTWLTFIRNHMIEIIAIDFFTVPTITFRTLYVFLIFRWIGDVSFTSTSQETPLLNGQVCN